LGLAPPTTAGGSSVSGRQRSPFARLRRHRRWSIPKTAAASLISVVYLYPFAFLVGTALKPQRDYVRDPIGLPHHFTLANLRQAWTTAGLGRGMINSVVAVSVGVVVCGVVSTAAAFWFFRHTTRTAKTLFAGILSIWIFPVVAYIIPFFVFAGHFGLTNSLFVYGIVLATFNTPFGVYLMYAYFREGLPVDVLESAAVDGAGLLQQFWRIVVPLSRPALGTLVAITFIYMWGDLLIGIVLFDDPNKFPIVVAASSLVTRFNAAVQLTSAASVITIIPMLVVFLLAQRAIVRGITAGIGK
jgi:raffinose/stachyose/melibiose transport system permease protein